MCPGCGGLGTPQRIYHVLGCGYSGEHEHPDPKEVLPWLQEHFKRRNKLERTEQVEKLREAIALTEKNEKDPTDPEALFDSLLEVLS